MRCLEKPYTIKEPQFLKQEDAIWYNTIFKPDCIPQNVKVGWKLMWKYYKTPFWFTKDIFSLQTVFLSVNCVASIKSIAIASWSKHIPEFPFS